LKTLSASDVRIPPKAFNNVAKKGERIRIVKRGGYAVALVPEEDLELLENLEDIIDVAIVEQRLAKMEATGEEGIPWEKVKKELDL